MWIFVIVGVVLFISACGTPPPCQGAYPYTSGTCELAQSSEQVKVAASLVKQFYEIQAPLPVLVVYEKGDCQAVMPDPSGHGNITIPQGKITLPDGRCVFGSWYPDSNTIYMTRLDWQATIAHELLHQKLFERDGDLDYGHVKPEWKTWVPAAVALIKERMSVP